MKRALLPLLLALSACVGTVGEAPAPGPGPAAAPQASRDLAARNFVEAVNRVEPVAERICREETRGVDCDFRISIDTRPGRPPNAFQTIDKAGRPQIIFTVALIAEARNADEIAFVVGHEAAHHIAGHIPRLQRSALGGAVLGGLIATAMGGDPAAVEIGQDIGATVGARRYSKEFELEADAIGTVIAHRAGYDPVRGAAFFGRIPDPGDRFLGTHPPNAQRMETVRRVAARL
jgi:predicted Zn-dependent protease